MDDSIRSNTRIAQNTLILYLRMGVMLVVNLYTSRVVLAALGIDDYGIYNVVGGIVAMLGFFNGTLSTAASRFITVSLGIGNKEKMSQTFSTVFIVTLMLGTIILLLSETAGLWWLNEKMVIPTDRILSARWVYQISVATIIVNVISVPYNATIIAHEKMKAFAYITLYDAFAKLGVAFLIGCEFRIDRLVFYSLLLFVIQLSNQFIYFQYCVRNFEESKLKLLFDRKLIKQMGAFISWSAYGSLVSVGCTQGLNIILNLFFGPAVNAARGVSVQVQHAVSLFTSNFQIAINPQITKAVAVNDYNESKKLLVASTKISFFLLCIIGIPIISGADWILSLWLKEVPAHSVNFVRIMLIICIFQSIANPLRIVNQAEGNIKKFQLYECSYLLLILPLSYLCLRIGTEPEIVFIVQLAIEITAQLIRAKIVLPKIQMSGTNYLFKVYCPICFSFLVSLGVVAILNRYLVNSVFCQLVGLIVVEMAVLQSFFIFGFNKTERKFLFNFAKKRFLHKK